MFTFYFSWQQTFIEHISLYPLGLNSVKMTLKLTKNGYNILVYHHDLIMALKNTFFSVLP